MRPWDPPLAELTPLQGELMSTLRGESPLFLMLSEPLCEPDGGDHHNDDEGHH
jgi:hypothetical protein